MEDRHFFLFSFFLNGNETLVGLVVDFNWFVDRKVFFFNLLLKVIPFCFDAFVELFSFFEDGDLEHVESFTVLDDKFEVVVDFFGIIVLSLLKFVHEGSEVHGVFDFLVVAGDRAAVDWLLEHLRALFISQSENRLEDLFLKSIIGTG